MKLSNRLLTRKETSIIDAFEQLDYLKDMNAYKTTTRGVLKPITNIVVVLVLSVLVIGNSFAVPSVAKADSIGSQIQALQNQNAANAAAVSNLQSQATSYQDAINHLQAQINLLQGEIANNTAKQNDLQNQIVANQQELAQQKLMLGADIKMTYVDGQPTTLEMLASSKNLSDFVNKEEYRTIVQNKIQDTLKKISDLEHQLNQQKQQITELLSEQSTQEAQVSSARDQQSNLLSLNQDQQSTYNQQTQANQAKIQSLIALQLAANSGTSASGYYFLRFPGPIAAHNTAVNDYPYANGGFGMSTAPGCVDNDGPDQWGYCTRQCVSYAAWAVQRSGRTAPKYYGNARDWVSAARRDGIPVFTSNPEPGDVAISTAGTWGHAMYVEQVSGNQIYVSQYNQQLNGQYSTQWRTWE